MNAWAPPQALIDAECAATITVQNDVCVEVLLFELFKVAEARFDERAAKGGGNIYRAWRIAVARYNAYRDLCRGEVTWH